MVKRQVLNKKVLLTFLRARLDSLNDSLKSSKNYLGGSAVLRERFKARMEEVKYIRDVIIRNKL